MHYYNYMACVFSPSASKTKIKDAHKRIMLVNHPDRGKCKTIAKYVTKKPSLFTLSTFFITC